MKRDASGNKAERQSDPSDMPLCDCQTLGHLNPEPVTVLALYAAAQHLRRRLELGLELHQLELGPAQHAPSLEPQDDAFLVSALNPTGLRALASLFSVSEQTQVLAVPVKAGQPVVGQIAPLSDWLERLGTPWFAEASRHLCFHFQPIVSVSSAPGQVYGYEALVRAQHRGDLIGAGPLLSAAAAHRQSRSFDAHARQEAIRQGYPQLGPDELLFINFAPGVIYNPDICLQTTFRTCQEVGADVSRLIFEVTESERFPDLTLLRRILQRYRAEGAQVALDDLGAGHTSLTYLAELRPDIVKLDRGLIQGLSDTDPRLPLVLALIRYAHDLEIRVVAEGIETAQELALLQQAGADYAQGYLLGRPAPQLTFATDAGLFG